MSAHELSIGSSSEWYTPRHVFESMGVRFDLDVSAPTSECPAYDFCDDAYTADSLSRGWFGFVWMNPPFGGRNAIVPWLEKFFDHGNGVALCPDRTSAPWWQRFAPMADAILFCSPKIHFIPGPGVEASSPGTGTTLFAAGERGVVALESARRAGLGLILQAPTKESRPRSDELKPENKALVESVLGYGTARTYNRHEIDRLIGAARAQGPGPGEAVDLANLEDHRAVHLNMLRGGIAKLTPAQIGHLYRGEEAVAVVNEVKRQNPDAFAATPTREA